jgi:hypothetical protein
MSTLTNMISNTISNSNCTKQRWHSAYPAEAYQTLFTVKYKAHQTLLTVKYEILLDLERFWVLC